MTTYNTKNPVPSADARDRYDNSQVFDELMNGVAPHTPDRLGVLRQSWAGMEQDFKLMLAASGFELPPIPYAAGTVIGRPSQLISYMDNLYSVKANESFPYTLDGTFATDESNLVLRTDQGLRAELAAYSGAGLVGRDGSTVDADLTALEGRTDALESDVATLQSEVAGAAQTVLAYGTPTGIDDTAMAAAMIAATNSLIVPQGVTLAVKNLILNDETLIFCQGTLKLPSGCADFDKVLYAHNKRAISLYVKELDGNAAGQTGPIGTHLLYATNPVDCVFNIDYAHNHYYPTDAVIVNTDGIRDTSSGAIFLYRPIRGSTSVKYLYSWGREGVQCREGVRHTFHDIRCQGVDGGPEYSGVQMSGTLNQGHNFDVDNAGASGIGWDTTYGVGSSWISTNTRENHGVNYGHPGNPATGSIITGVTVIGAYRSGIQISSTTLDLSLVNVVVEDAGELGVSISDSSLRLRVTNALVRNCGAGNLSAAGTTLKAYNVQNTDIDAGGLLVVTPVTGMFKSGETVTSDGVTGEVRKVIKNRSATSQTLFLSSKSGTFVAAKAITGSTSGASGTINLVRVPLLQRAISGGVITVV